MASIADLEKDSTINHPSGSEDQQEVVQIPILKLNPEDEEGVKELFEAASKITIMVTGETGVGKSTLLNALVGHPLFETGRSKKQAVTTHVTERVCVKDDVKVVVIDCPGLHDGTDNEDMYLQEMYDKINAHGGVDLLLYCKKMTERRAKPKSDADIITKLTHKLGREIWQHTMFVLTNANIYEESLKERNYKQSDITAQFKQKKREWKIYIRDTLKKCGIECRIKVCAAGHINPKLCGKSYWLSDFWGLAYKIQDENGSLALMRLNQSRIVEDAPKEAFQQELHAQPLILTKKLEKALVGASAAAAIGLGTAIGATAGALIGAFGIGVISFGTAAGAGLVIGGVAGGSIGSSIGAAILALYLKRKAKKQKAATAEKLTAHQINKT